MRVKRVIPAECGFKKTRDSALSRSSTGVSGNNLVGRWQTRFVVIHILDFVFVIVEKAYFLGVTREG